MKNEFDVTGAAGTDISTATWIIGLATALVVGVALGVVTADAAALRPERVGGCEHRVPTAVVVDPVPGT